MTPRQAAVAASSFKDAPEHVIDEGPPVDIEAAKQRIINGVLDRIRIMYRLTHDQVASRPVEDVIRWIRATGFKRDIQPYLVTAGVKKWVEQAEKK